MADVVVTVPKALWAAWIEEGDLPGDRWSGKEYDFYLGGPMPKIKPGERVYVVAHGRLRGYAPLVGFRQGAWSLVRHDGAVAVTIPEPIRGFQGFRYRWWDRSAEQAFPDWRNPEPAPALLAGQGEGAQ